MESISINYRPHQFKSMDDESFKECWDLDNLMPLEIPTNHRLGQLFRSWKDGILEPTQTPYVKVNGSLLPWVLEEITRNAAMRVLNNKKEAELCL